MGKQVTATAHAESQCSASYFGWENRYRWQIHVALYILGRKTGTRGRYTSRFIFWVGKQVVMAGTLCASCFGWVIRYLPLARSQIHADLYILGGKTSTCDRPGPTYKPGFIFWVGKQTPATGEVSGTCRASYFGSKNRYLRPARSQVHAGLHILDGKTGTRDRPGLRYLTGFIFWVGKQVPATGQVSGTCRASYFG